MNHAHLAMPDPDLRTCGKLSKNDHGWSIEGEPAVMEVARRVFPGALSQGRSMLTFPDSRRQLEELLWFMQRFPLSMESEVRGLLADRRKGVMQLAQERQTRDEIALVGGSAFRGELRPYQKVGTGFLVQNRKCLLADDMGLGKTIQAIAGLSEVNQWPVVIVAEPQLLPQWRRQLDAFLEPRFGGWAGILTGIKPSCDDIKPIYLIHYGLLRHWQNWLVRLNAKVVIFDEVQNLRRTGSEKYSAASRLSDGTDYVWGLSGTPIYNYGVEMWAVFNAIDHYCLGGADGFSREWCAGYQSKIVDKAPELGDYLRREGLMLRRLKSEVLNDLPPKRRIVQAVDHDESVFGELIAETIDRLGEYDNAADHLEKGRISRIMETETRLATGMAKAEVAADFIGSLVEAGERPLVFLHHHDVYDAVIARLQTTDAQRTGDLRCNAVEVSGRKGPGEKAKAIEAFVKGDAKVCLLGLRSSAGIDGLQGHGTCVVFVELDWSPAVHAQDEDRLHRFGMTARESLLCYYLVCRAGTDESMQEAIGLKIQQFQGIMGQAPTSPEEQAIGEQAAEGRMRQIVEQLRKMKRDKDGNAGRSGHGKRPRRAGSLQPAEDAPLLA